MCQNLVFVSTSNALTKNASKELTDWFEFHFLSLVRSFVNCEMIRSWETEEKGINAQELTKLDCFTLNI